MSQQTFLDNYFKSKASPMSPAASTDTNKLKKKRSLSLNRAPCKRKTPKKDNQENTSNTPEDIVVVSSDSEVERTPNKTQDVSTNNTINSSLETIVYSLSPINQETQHSPETPSKLSTNTISVRKDLFKEHEDNSNEGAVPSTQHTPSKTPPSKSGKYFSPTKKRVVTKRTPTKKNLTQQFNDMNAFNDCSEHEFLNACEGQDDKTIFLLSIINKFLKNVSMNGLLGEDSQKLLAASMHVVKPGMRLVCRLYWCKPVWYRKEKLAKMCTEKTANKSPENKATVDVSKIDAMLKSLVEAGLLECSTVEGKDKLDLADYASVLQSAELQKICKGLKINETTKEGAVRALRKFSNKTMTIDKFFKTNRTLDSNRDRVMAILRQAAGLCYQLSHLARTTLNKLYVLMYLGMDITLIRDKKLELMLINEKIQRETYPIDKDMIVDDASIVFRNNDEFERYFQAHRMYEEFLALTFTTNASQNQDEPKKQAKEIIYSAFTKFLLTANDEKLRCKTLPPWLRRFTPSNIYVKILASGIKELKTLKDYSMAVRILRKLIEQNVFRIHKKAEWYAELALIQCTYLDNCEKAAKVLIKGFRTDISDEAKDSMRPRAVKIATQLNLDLSNELRQTLLEFASKHSILEKNHPGIHIYKHPNDNYNPRGKLMFEVRNENERLKVSAENYCILHLKEEGRYTHGEHWEGRIVTTIFSLLFWDIIYTNPVGVRGVFLSHYQRHPLDMFSDSFYINRKTLIDDRLATIEDCSDDTFVYLMDKEWNKRPEHEMSDIQRGIGWENIKMVAECLGGRAVAALCRRLAMNYGYTHSGFPDLTMWNIHTKKITFIEVKTDADQPSIKQLQWMDYLNSCGIEAMFCYVGANTMRQRARPGRE